VLGKVRKYQCFFLQSCIAFGKTPDVEEGMSLRVRMQPRGRAWSEDVNGNFEIVLKEVSMRRRGQPRPETSGIKFCPESLRAINDINRHRKIQLCYPRR